VFYLFGMTKILALVFIFVGSVSIAQTVQKVNGNDVVIDITTANKAQVGDKIIFLDAGLNKVGEGTLSKVSTGGSKAIVHLQSGTAQPGSVWENSNSVKAEPLPPQVNLTESDKDILERGEISTTRYVVGGLLSIYPGFGIGQAVEKRYMERGWIFTVGEVAAIGVLAVGVSECALQSIGSSSTTTNCTAGAATLGLFGFLGFKIWEVVDAWVVPLNQNDRYHELTKGKNSDLQIRPYLYPLASGGGGGGINIAF